MIDIKLSLDRIIKQLRYNKISLLLATISAVLCILSFSSLFIRYMPHFNDSRKNNTKYRYYNLIFTESISPEQFKEILSFTPKYESITVTNVKNNVNISYENEKSNGYLIAFYKESEYINNIELKDSSISKYSDLKDNEVLLPKINFDKNFPDNIKIRGKILKVKGTWNGIDNLITFDTFMNLSEINQIIIRTSQVLNSDELEDFNLKLLNYPLKLATTPINAYENDSSMSKIIIFIINIIYIISLLSYSMIFSVLLSFLEKDFKVYRIVGMTKLRIIFGLLIDLFVFISMCSIIAFGVQEYFWDSFFSKANNYEFNRIIFKDYFIIFILVIILSFIIISPYIYKTVTNIINRKKGID